MTLSIIAVGQCLPFDLAGRDPADAARAVGLGCTPDWFDVTARLGRRGYRYLPLPSQLAAAAGRELNQLAHEWPEERRSLWLGCASAAARIHAPLDNTIRASSSDDISPAGAPFFSVNLVAGRLSTDLAARGGVTTFTTPSTAVMDAMAAADASLLMDRCDVAVVAAVEVPPDQGEPEVDGRECGAVAFVTTAADAQNAVSSPTAEISIRRGLWSPDTLLSDIAELIGDVEGLDPGSVPQVCVCALPPALAVLAHEDAVRSISERLAAVVSVVPVSAGSLAATAAIAASALGGIPQVVVVAGALGHLAAALVRPSTLPGGNA